MTETIIKTITKRHKSAGSKKGRQHVAHQGKYKRQFDRTARNKTKARKERHAGAGKIIGSSGNK